MLGTLRRRGEEQRGRGRHAEGRSVVLRQVVTEKAGGVRRLQELQPLLIKLMQGRFAPINPIEQSKGHLRHGVFPPSLRTAARACISRLLKKAFSCFDRLSTNGKSPTTSSLPPFALSLSKGERRVFQHPAKPRAPALIEGLPPRVTHCWPAWWQCPGGGRPQLRVVGSWSRALLCGTPGRIRCGSLRQILPAPACGYASVHRLVPPV